MSIGEEDEALCNDRFTHQRTINQESTEMSPEWFEYHFITSSLLLCQYHPLKFSNDIWHLRLAKLKINNEIVIFESNILSKNSSPQYDGLTGVVSVGSHKAVCGT